MAGKRPRRSSLQLGNWHAGTGPFLANLGCSGLSLGAGGLGLGLGLGPKQHSAHVLTWMDPGPQCLSNKQLKKMVHNTAEAQFIFCMTVAVV